MLLSDLNGGQGLGTLGYMKLTDGNGNSVNVNLAGAVTLQDVINDINSQIQSNNAQAGARPWTSRPRSTPPATASNWSIRPGAPSADGRQQRQRR